MSNKTAKMSLFLSVIALITSAVIVCGAVFAWFTMSEQTKTDAVKISIVDRNDDGFKISFENGTFIDDDLDIYPESYVDLKLTALRDCAFIKVRLSYVPLNEDSFDDDYKAFFETRNDLLLAGYEEKQPFTDADGDSVYREFDIEKATEDTEERLAFLREFALQNSLISAISAKVIDKNNVDVENGEITEFENEVLVGVNFAVAYGETVTLRIQYGLNGFQPEIKNYVLGNKAQNDYRALNYNCFIGQSFKIEIFGILD